MFELALRLRIGFAKPAERLVDLGRRPGFWLRLTSSPPASAAALTAFFAGFFGTDGTLVFLALFERMILAMIGIY